MRLAFTVAVVFVGTGITWVLLTDVLLYSFENDPVLIAQIETVKGWVFVCLWSFVLYFATFWSASRFIRAQRLVSAVVQSIGDGVFLVGSDRTIVYANPAALRMLHCELADVVGMGASEFSRRFRPAYPDGSLVPPERFLAARLLVEGGPLHSKAVLHPTEDEELVLSTTAAAVREEVGEPPHEIVSVMHDVTVSENLERLRDQLFAGAAHAIKTPVAIIKANVQVLSQEASPRFRRSAGAVELQCGRIDRLVQNILVLSRARSRTLQLYLTPVDLGTLVGQVAGQERVAPHPREVRAEIVDAPRVRVDRERFALALHNLLDVALRSSLPGSPVTLVLRQRDGNAELGVRYAPLSPEELACEGTGEYDDLGIARAVTKLVAEAHGGSLREETDGAETASWVRLPAVVAVAR
jgi:signal transduction histidine kinase